MRVPLKWISEYIDLPKDIKIFTDKMSMIGHLLDKTEVTQNDTVIDFELRGNRADCFSILGLAREAHAAFNGRFDIPETPEISKDKYEGFKVEIKADKVKRFYSALLKNIEIKESPEWMKSRLKDYGIESKNNIVDITNYVMVETGMPMHAFDLKNMGGNSLTLRMASEGETFTTFDNVEIKLNSNDIVFAGGNGSVLGLAGVIGGINSGINEGTTEILLECAGYDRVSIRKSMYGHKLMTEAGLRHSHDLSASQCDYAMKRAVALIGEFANGMLTGIDDNYPIKEDEKRIEYNPSEAKRLGGVEIDSKTQKEILERLEFTIEANDDKLTVTPPLFRTDIFESADIVEEVLRIYGYENIPSTALSSSIPMPIINNTILLEDKSKDIFIALGMNEIITVPLVSLDSLKKTTDTNEKEAIGIVNPPTSEHTHLRTNMLTGLLNVTGMMLDRGDRNVAIFESGRIYLKKKELVHQPPHKLDFPYSEFKKITGIFSSKDDEYDFYNVKGIVEEYLRQLGILNITFRKIENSQFDLAANIMQEESVLGVIGIISQNVTRLGFDIKEDVLMFEVDIEGLEKGVVTPINYMPFSDYPGIKQDISIIIPRGVTSGEIMDTIKNNSKEMLKSIEITDVYEIDSNNKSVLYSLFFQSSDKTLSTDEANEIRTQIENILKEKFKVTIR